MPGDFTIRKARVDDILCISALGQQVFIDTYATDGIRPGLARKARAQHSTSRIEAELAESSIQILVAESHSHLIGYATVNIGTTSQLIKDARQSEVQTLYVLRRFERLGVGSGLLREAELQARNKASDVGWLTVWSRNTDAIEFYRARG